MAGQRLKDLVVKIRANTAEFNTRMGEVAKKTEAVGKRMESLGRDLTTRLTAPVLAAGGALGAAALRVGAMADELLDLEQQTGLTTDQLQEYRYAATVAGVESDAFAGAAMKLTNNLQAAGEESKATQAALRMIGVSARDSQGRLRPMSELFPEIIGALQGMNDVTTRNSLAADIFGRSWTNVAPALGMTTAEMERARKSAHDLGLVLSKEQLAKADEFRLGWETLKRSMGAAANEIGLSVLPLMAAMVRFVQGNVIPVIRSLADWIGNLSPATQGAVAALAALVAGIGPLLVGTGALLRVAGGLKGAFALLVNPVGLTIAALGALAVTTWTVAKNWDVLKLQGALAWTAIKDVVFSSVGAILELLAKLTEHIPFVGDKVAGLRNSFQTLADRSLAASNDRIVQLEREIATNFRPALQGTAADVDGLKLAVDGAAGSVAGLSEKLKQLSVTAPNMGKFGFGTPESLAQWKQAQENIRSGLITMWDLKPLTKEYHVALDDVVDETRLASADIADSLTSAFDTSARSFGEFARAFMARIRDMIARMLIFRLLAQMFSPFAAGTGLGAALFHSFMDASGFGGARAEGGPIMPGRTYLVGERGPELIESRASGTVRPLVAGPSTAPSVTFSFDVSRLPPPPDPLSAARDAEWLRFVGETLRTWEANGGRLRYAGA